MADNEVPLGSMAIVIDPSGDLTVWLPKEESYYPAMWAAAIAVSKKLMQDDTFFNQMVDEFEDISGLSPATIN